MGRRPTEYLWPTWKQFPKRPEEGTGSHFADGWHHLKAPNPLNPRAISATSALSFWPSSPMCCISQTGSPQPERNFWIHVGKGTCRRLPGVCVRLQCPSWSMWVQDRSPASLLVSVEQIHHFSSSVRCRLGILLSGSACRALQLVWVLEG